MEVTVDASATTVFKGITGERDASCKQDTPCVSNAFDKKMEYLFKFIAELRLVDPDSDDFRPEGCRSMHDIIRFTHETGLREMFFSSCRTSSRRHGALLLVSDVPLKVFVLDVNNGIDKNSHIRSKGSVSMEHILSIPMQALWKGLSHPDISWSDFEHFDWKTVDSIVMAGGITTGKSSEFASYAVIAKEYLNLNMKFGYHFTIVDTLCSGEDASNYINIRFAGGGGGYEGRMLRLEFVKQILGRWNFSISSTGDLIDARFQHGDVDAIVRRLDITGRLLAVTRLMDMTLHTKDDVVKCVNSFMEGDYSFTASLHG
jgi:pyruvate,water dikinase